MQKTVDAVKTLFAMVGSVAYSETALADIAALTNRPVDHIEALHRVGKLGRFGDTMVCAL